MLLPSLLCSSLLLLPQLLATPTAQPQPTLHPRQDDLETRTFSPSTSSLELQPGGPEQTASATTTYRLETATPPLQLPDTVGLIMPNPWSKLYVGLNYSLGFVDVVPRPAPTIGGWLRAIQPLLMLPNQRIDVFPSSGSGGVDDEGSVPPGSDGLCGFTAENYAISYPFVFENPGWYMFILNQTLFKPTVVSTSLPRSQTQTASDPQSDDHTCQAPIISQDTFFATQSFSVGPAPTENLTGWATQSAYTVFADVSAETPGTLPIDPQAMTPHERVAVGLGVTAGILAAIGVIVTIWWLRRKRRHEAELVAFNRLSEADKAAFLAENPDSMLNPNRQGRLRQNVYTDRPPAPPGTMAYAQWYWTHLMGGQPQHPGWNQTPQGYGGMQPQQGYGPVPGYNPGPQMYQPQMSQMYPQQPFGQGVKIR